MILILLAAAAISGALAVYENESFTDVIIILFCSGSECCSGGVSGEQGGEGH